MIGRLAVLAAWIVAAPARAQIDPSHRWFTIPTQHFYVHFTSPVEPLARRIAADAERAYQALSKELSPPRTKIDVVVTDDADYSNGSATPYPTNRIVIYANPPVSESALRYTNDWGQLVITHELTHIFHLERTRGIWAIGQRIFGRAALLFPNMYDPSWLTEGLAVYEESKLTGAGRIQGSEHRMIAEAAGLEHTYQSIGRLSLAQGRYPFGESAYAFGSLFVDYLAQTRGDSTVRRFVDKSAANLVPYLIDIPAKQGFGISFTQGWKNFIDSVNRSVAAAPAFTPWRQLTNDGVFVFDPRWLTDSSIVYSGTPGRQTFGAYRVDLTGKRTRLGRRNSASPNVPLANGGLLYAQLDFTNPYQQRSDLWIQRGRRQHQLTFGQRLTSPDARADGEIVAVQIIPGATRLVRVSADGKRVTPITTGSYDEQWTEPRWSHAGDRIVAIRWLRGNITQIVVLDSSGTVAALLSSANSITATPSWAVGDSGVFYRSDRLGRPQLYYLAVTPAGAPARHYVQQFDRAVGRFEPDVSPAGDHLASVAFRSDGYHLSSSSCCNFGDSVWRAISLPPRDSAAAPFNAPAIADNTPATAYSPWRTLYPRYWLPTIDPGIDNGYRIGATTSGYDAIGRHAMTAKIAIPTNNTGITGSVSYQYSGLGLPILQVDGAQGWESLGGVFSRDPQRRLIGEVFRRTLSGDALATWVRRRYRTSMSVTGGVGIEYRTHSATPTDDLLAAIDTTGIYGHLAFPSLIAGVGFANYQRPSLSISPEDGVQLNVTVRDRTKSGATGTGGQSLSAVASASIYKSLPLPGFSRHVLAVRGAGGYADDRAAGYYSVGGVSGNPFEIIPGYVIGEGRKTFPVRGFAPGSLIGIRAYTGSVEYRVPLYLAGRGPGDLPFFLDRSSLSFFGDYGAAWCPTITAGREVCNRSSQSLRAEIGSVGGELNVSLGVLSWDSPTRFRIGLALPAQNGGFFKRDPFQLYFVSGISF